MSGRLAPRLGRDRLVALGAACIAALALAYTFTFDKVPAALMEGMGAAEFPQLICVVILLLSACLFFARPAPAEEGEALPPVHACSWWTLGLCFGFFGVLALAGMLVAMFVFPIAAGLVWGERRLHVLVPSSAIVTLLIWLLFVRVFQFTLPGGLLGEALFG
jgi:putative tricarboxylic transport membrane protein